jgi:hypothetical protein
MLGTQQAAGSTQDCIDYRTTYCFNYANLLLTSWYNYAPSFCSTVSSFASNRDMRSSMVLLTSLGPSDALACIGALPLVSAALVAPLGVCTPRPALSASCAADVGLGSCTLLAARAIFFFLRALNDKFSAPSPSFSIPMAAAAIAALPKDGVRVGVEAPGVRGVDATLCSRKISRVSYT